MTSEWDTGSSDEEIIIFNTGNGFIFDFPRRFFNKYLKRKLKFINPRRVYYRKDPNGRVRLFVDGEKASELRVWLTVFLSENDEYFLTEIELL